VGIPQGWVQVRENQIEGTRLKLRGDLGIDTSKSLTVGVARHLSLVSTLQLTVDATFLYGSTTLPGDVDFNGATLEGGTKLDTRPDFLRVTALYERHLVNLKGGGHLAGQAGFTYVLLTFKLYGTLSPQTKGTETKEDFLTQELPVPILGFSLDQPLGERLSLVGSLTGGYLPLINSLRAEGGEVKLTQSHADVALGLRWLLTPALAVSGGYRFTYFVQREISGEDDNNVRLRDKAFSLSLGYRF
jgi:hypothetical protein